LKTVEPIIIQQDLRTGEVFVKPGDPSNLVKTKQETESDCVRYIVARETYALVDEEVRYRQVRYMSTRDVFGPYTEARNPKNLNSFQARLGAEGLRTVVIEDIVFLDASDPNLLPEQRVKIRPIAKVDFTTTEMDGRNVVKQYWVATLRFEYLGTPDVKEAAWANWDGFTVTDYRIDQRNV
jgi:type IV secretory pathway component VirB8